MTQKSLLEVSQDCFHALIQLKASASSPEVSPEVLHTRMRGFIDKMRREAVAEGFSERDAEEASYAIVALTDEIMLQQSGPVRDYWLPRMLQLHYFRENLAGENFFLRLSELRRDARRSAVLAVFFHCLLFGFQGKYQIRGGEVELAVLREELEAELRKAKVLQKLPLSPRGARPKETTAGLRGPGWLRLAALGAALLSLLLYVGLRISISSQAEQVNESFQNLME